MSSSQLIRFLFISVSPAPSSDPTCQCIWLKLERNNPPNVNYRSKSRLTAETCYSFIFPGHTYFQNTDWLARVLWEGQSHRETFQSPRERKCLSPETVVILFVRDWEVVLILIVPDFTSLGFSCCSSKISEAHCLLGYRGCCCLSKLVDVFSLQTPWLAMQCQLFLRVLLITRTATDRQPAVPDPSRQTSRFTRFPLSIKQSHLAADCKLQKLAQNTFPRIIFIVKLCFSETLILLLISSQGKNNRLYTKRICK